METTICDELALLQTLPLLHHLKLCNLSESVLSCEGMHALRQLELYNCDNDIYDLHCSTQITRLSMDWFSNMPRAVLLPAGSNVSLQHLSLRACQRLNGQESYRLDSLPTATQLTCIQFHGAYPHNLSEHGWPASMPNLQGIYGSNLPLGPPQQLVGYSSLRHLSLHCFNSKHAGVVLPSWLSRLTQLESLGLHAKLSEFPNCLLHLKQLQFLNLTACGLETMQLPATVLGFLDFTALTSLDLFHYDGFDAPLKLSSHNEQLFAVLKQSLRPDVFHYKVED